MNRDEMIGNIKDNSEIWDFIIRNGVRACLG